MAPAAHGLEVIAEIHIDELHSGQAKASPEKKFLSTFINPPGFLSLDDGRHDYAAGLWTVDRGTLNLDRYWEFERVSGLKHHCAKLYTSEEADQFFSLLLEREGLCWDDIQATWGTPGIAKSDSAVFEPYLSLGISLHALAHLYCVLASDFTRLASGHILAFSLDGGADWMLDRTEFDQVGCYATDGFLRFFPVVSPARLWATAARNFGVEEGSLMALASACGCDAVKTPFPHTLIRDRANVHPLVDAITDDATTALSSSVSRGNLGYDDRFSFEENVAASVMKRIQAISIASITDTVASCIEAFGIRPEETVVGIAGGFGLNCPTNSAVMDQFSFQAYGGVPCANDGGQALGIGLMGFHSLFGVRNLNFSLRSAYHGNGLGDIEAAIETYRDAILSVTKAPDVSAVVSDICRGPIAWASGNAEIGPRALGNRSLLADPRHQSSADRLNEIKQRQWWRPVAPVVLRDDLHNWFDQPRHSPYMLEIFRAKKEAVAQVPAILHIDGSARLQSVGDENPPLLGLVRAFKDETGVPMLCNTSLNDKGEPLVDSATEVLDLCVRKGVEVAYLDGLRVELKPVLAGRSTQAGRHPRLRRPFDESATHRSALWAAWLGLGLPAESLFFYTRLPAMRRLVADWTPAGVGRFKRAVEIVLAQKPAEEREIVGLLVERGPGHVQTHAEEWVLRRWD